MTSTKTSLKKRNTLNSPYFKLYRAYSNSFNSPNVGKFFLSWILKDCIKVQEKKEKVFVFVGAFTLYSCSDGKKNVQKSVMHVQSCCFVSLNLLLFCRSRCCRRRRCLSSLFKRKLTVTTLTADLLATSANNTSLTFMAFARRLLRSFLVFNFFFLGS